MRVLIFHSPLMLSWPFHAIIFLIFSRGGGGLRGTGSGGGQSYAMFVGIGQEALAIGKRAPEFTLPAASGRMVSFNDYRGKKIFLFFFRGTWCPQCGKHMRAIHEELSGLQDIGVDVLGICCQGIEPMAAFWKRENFFFPLLSDKNRETAKAYGVHTYLSWDSINIARPSFFYIDGEGIIRYRYVGAHQWDRPDMEIIKKLAVQSPS